jgi:hypothetical protein
MIFRAFPLIGLTLPTFCGATLTDLVDAANIYANAALMRKILVGGVDLLQGWFSLGQHKIPFDVAVFWRVFSAFSQEKSTFRRRNFGVRPAGLEPATHGLEIRCSIRLS